MYRYAPTFADPKSSPIRALFKYLSVPGMISFAGGYPDQALFDVEGLRMASTQAYEDSLECLQYGGTDGTPRMKTQIVRLMQRRGVTVRPDNVIVTTGSQQAFDLFLRVILSPNDLVFVEQPTYSTNIHALHSYQARIQSVPVDSDGLDVALLSQMLAASDEAGDLPKFLYTVPTFGNPTGGTLSASRRVGLLELAAKYKFLIVEDDPYGDLRFGGAEVPSLLALSRDVPGAEEWVVHLASLSKIVAPGIRVGWAVAPLEIAKRCTIAKQSADIGSSPWMQAIASEYLAGRAFDAHLERIRKVYGDKCKFLCKLLRERASDLISFREPEGGMFVWAKLKNGVIAEDFLKVALERKVMFVPGGGFFADNADSATLRLSFAAPSLEQIETGVQRLVDALYVVNKADGISQKS